MKILYLFIIKITKKKHLPNALGIIIKINKKQKYIKTTFINFFFDE